MKEKNQRAQSRLNLPSPFSLMQEMSVGNVVLAFPVSSTLACCVSIRFVLKRIALLAPHPVFIGVHFYAEGICKRQARRSVLSRRGYRHIDDSLLNVQETC